MTSAKHGGFMLQDGFGGEIDIVITHSEHPKTEDTYVLTFLN